MPKKRRSKGLEADAILQLIDQDLVDEDDDGLDMEIEEGHHSSDEEEAGADWVFEVNEVVFIEQEQVRTRTFFG
jgi:hypothetical protein